MNRYTSGTFTGQFDLTPSNLIVHPVFNHVTSLTINFQSDLHVNLDIESIPNAFPHLQDLSIKSARINSFENPSEFNVLANKLKDIVFFDLNLDSIPFTMADLKMNEWLGNMNKLTRLSLNSNELKGDPYGRDKCHFDLRGIDFPEKLTQLSLNANDWYANVCVDFEMTQKERKEKLFVYISGHHGTQIEGGLKNMGHENSMENEFVRFFLNMNEPLQPINVMVNEHIFHLTVEKQHAWSY